MIKVIKHESRRFYKLLLLIALLYSCFSLINFNHHNEHFYRFEASLIHFLISGFAFYLMVCFLIDDFSKRKLLYLKSDISQVKIIIGKLLVIMLFSVLLLVIGATLFNIKALLYQRNHPLEFIRMNLDYVGLLIVDKSLKEWFYAINFLLNLFIKIVIIFGMVTYYRSQIKKENKLEAFLKSLLFILLPISFIYPFVRRLNKNFKTLDFNYISPRVKAMLLAPGEINFLSITSLFVYCLLTIVLIYFISKKRAEDRL